MDTLVPVGVAAILALIAWKVVRGMLKIVAFLAIVAVIGVLHWQGVF